jgi:hypothetical protein
MDDYLTRFLLEGEKHLANESLAALHFNDWINYFEYNEQSCILASIKET